MSDTPPTPPAPSATVDSKIKPPVIPPQFKRAQRKVEADDNAVSHTSIMAARGSKASVLSLIANSAMTAEEKAAFSSHVNAMNGEAFHLDAHVFRKDGHCIVQAHLRRLF